jgi:membrane protease YdiL (CAAX protease family)
MRRVTAQSVRRPLGEFFLLTYAVTWACWFLAWRLQHAAPAVAGLGGPVFLLGVFAPALVALALSARAEGRAGALALLRPILHWRVRARWYVFAAGYVAAVKLTVALVLRAVTGHWPQFGNVPWYLMAAALLVSTWVQAGEEVGWRGYALPRMASRMGLGPASLVLGVIWASWHLPLFFYPGADTAGQSFPVYLLQVTALSVAMAWLYWRTDGSLLLVMLLHAAVNNTKDVVPSAVADVTDPFALSRSPVAWLTVALLWICAAYFLARMWNVRLNADLRPSAFSSGAS